MSQSPLRDLSVEQPQRNLRLPRHPRSWYRFGMSRDVVPAKKPVARESLGRDLVAFRTQAGELSVLNGRCSHLGARLKYGEIKSDRLECPLHGWCYDQTGACVHIPSAAEIPAFARQQRYPVVERFGEIFYFLGDEPAFEFPRFEGRDFSELHAARPFGLELAAPWYMITGNGFDVQHFRLSHDRTLLSEPVVDHPQPDAIRIRMRLGVEGDCLRDQLIRRLAGPELNFSYTCWGGSLGFVQAEFANSTSYGFVAVSPLGADRTYYSNTIFVEHTTSRLRALFQPIHAELRRLLIFQFLKVDIHRIEGTWAAVDRCIEADWALLRYFDWVQRFND